MCLDLSGPVLTTSLGGEAVPSVVSTSTSSLRTEPRSPDRPGHVCTLFAPPPFWAIPILPGTQKNPALAGFFWEVSDGDRTRDRRNHNPELYQLSYAHHGRPAV